MTTPDGLLAGGALAQLNRVGVFGVALLVACSEGAPPDRTVSVTWDTLESGVTLVSYSAIPSAPRWTVEPDLRLGSVDGEGHDVFGDIRGVDVDANGRILVLDGQASEILAFGPDGTFQELVATEGEGPREIKGANGIRVDSDGAIWIHDYGKFRFTRLLANGEVETSPLLVRGFGYVWDGGVTLDGRVWSPWTHYEMPPQFWMEPGVRHAVGRTYYINRDLSTGRVDSVFIGPAPIHSIQRPRGSSLVPFSPELVHALDPHGSVWIALTNSYRAARLTVAGDTTVIVDVHAQPEPVTSEDRQEAIARSEKFAQRAGHVDIDWDEVMPQTKPLLRKLIVDDEGRLWIQRRIGDEDVFDVFTTGGRFLGTIDPAFPFLVYFPVVIRDGSLYALQTDSLDVQYVVRARLPRLH